MRVRAERRDGTSIRLLARTLDPRQRPEDLGWHMVDVPLDAAGTGPVRLVFEAKGVRSSDPLVFPLWADPTIFAPPVDAPAIPAACRELRCRSMHDVPSSQR
jgi:hypothetical protein